MIGTPNNVVLTAKDGFIFEDGTENGAVLGFGYVPFIILNIFILSKATKATIIPIIIAIVSTFHYPVVFFLPGQIILGYLLAQKYKHANVNLYCK